MPLSVGAKLGPYEILTPIGAGGMGEVYRARDTKLKREVALKVLPDAFASDPDRMLRFQREAEVLASLNHPHIAHIYGVEERALVMELVEGETLPGGLPLDAGLNYAKQIAEALEYAHERGVIHRDLKPANIKVTPEGVVKLLDFGLAKAIEDPAAASEDPSKSPTLTLGATRVGMILGTAAYMSPEQANGKAADRRADIWSFGAVLYEMLTGKRAFEGESTSDTLASVLKLDPDWNALPAETPASIRKLVQRCLTKDRKQRLQAIGEARIAIEESLSGAPPETTESVPAGRRILPWVAVTALAVVSIGLGGALWRATRPVERPLVRLDVDLGSEVALPPLSTIVGNVSLSPDGKRLVYLTGDPRRLYTRRLDQSKANELPGTDGAALPFFSPDGQWVGFFTANKLNKISVEGGAVVSLAEVSGPTGATWGADGNIIVGQPPNKGLVRVSVSGGAPTTVLDLAPGESAYIAPQILPGGKAVLFVDYRTPDANTASIEVFSFADRRRKTLVPGSTFARYLPSGHLIYTNKGTLFAIPFDADRFETRGTAVPILDDVAYDPQSGAGRRMMTIQWVDEAGKKEPLLAKPGAYGSPRISPDDKRIALIVNDVVSPDVWVYDPQRGAMTRLTFGAGLYTSPIWSPDGRYIVFGEFLKGIYWTRADGAGQPQPLTQSKNFQFPWSLTPDGRRLAYYEVSGNSQIWTLPLEEQGGPWKAGKPEQFLKSQFSDLEPAFSPDGRWLAYMSNESGKNEVYVRAFPPPASGQGGKWQISNSGGRDPMWSRNGRELIYLAGDQLMAVNYSVNRDSFVAEKPRVWIEKLGGTDWSLAPDGKRVAVLTPVEPTEAPKPDHEVTFLFNFFDELRRRVPVGK
jgi:serine/threonine protein kinase/Tol biopolymer transport system component